MVNDFFVTKRRSAALLLVAAMLLGACDLGAVGGEITEPADAAAGRRHQLSEPSEKAEHAEDARAGEGSDEGWLGEAGDYNDGGVKTVENAKRVVLPGGEVREGEMLHLDIPARDSYWLDYTATFDPRFFYTKAGKLPGLAGGNATTGCDTTDPGGWSARLGWTLDGRGKLYLYHQDRDNECGDNYYFTIDKRYRAGATHRLTQWIQLNTPGRNDGVIQVWLDGELAVTAKNLELRGSVDSDRARIDTLAYSVFSGGKEPSIFAPPHDQAIDFGPIRIATCRPDFDSAQTRCDDS